MAMKYQICTRCIMDTSDPEISFDQNGICNNCKKGESLMKINLHKGEEGKIKLASIVDRIKKNGKGKAYDCVIGVSGGVDSTYVAYLTTKLGLRPLAVHLDNGWDSELSVSNIEKALKKLNIELQTEVLDWDEFRNLQLAFLRASVPDLEIPSDHAIVAVMFKTARDNGLKYILAGHNTATESILPRTWSQGHYDWKYISTLNKLFGTSALKTYPHFSMQKYIINRQRFTWVNILDYVDYSKNEAMKVLENELSWQYYGGKHYESVYTRFIQGYILPQKFGFDKRRAHLSNLICMGEVSREEALELMQDAPYSNELQEEDRRYVIKKLGLTEDEFDQLMNLPNKYYGDYPSYNQTLTYRFLRAVFNKFRGLDS